MPAKRNATDPPAEFTDCNLVGRVLLRDDRTAFAELVRRHQSALRASLRRMTGGNAALSDDIAQETFILAWRNIGSFRHEAKFSTWLYRIACNTAISRKRRKRVEASVDRNREQSGLEPVDAGDAPGDQMIRDEQAAQVHQALAALSEEHRSILVLREMDGCDYEQIAEILDINVGTVRSRLHRARSDLHRRMGPVLSGERATPAVAREGGAHP